MPSQEAQPHRVECVVTDWFDEERRVVQRVACIDVPALGLHFAVNLDANAAHVEHASATTVTRSRTDGGSGDTPPNWSKC